MNTLHAVVVFVAMWISVAAFGADECPGGSPSDSACKRELAKAERTLASAQSKKESRLRVQYESPSYGGSEGLGYLKETIDAFRASNRAWRLLRDKECWFLALNDGMSLSPDYASPVSEACKLARTKERIEWMEK